LIVGGAVVSATAVTYMPEAFAVDDISGLPLAALIVPRGEA